ncbi:MAG: hypothetical protein EPO28_14070 [Saprospiraceae bacterium]|nr:MAG: hypothetical protein EPO28_14070 [Saprospiraceae bacterium]
MRKFQIFTALALLAFVLLFSCKSEPTTHWKHNDNTVRVGLPAGIKTLNPYLYRTSYESTALNMAYQYLMGFDPKTLELVPQLVKSAPLIQDITEGKYTGGQTFTYEILDEAVWDDGKPVTGYDYLFSLKAVFNPKMPTQRFLPYLESLADVQVDAANPKKFTVFTKDKYFLAEPAASNWVVLPEHIFDPQGLMKGFELSDLTNPEKAATLAGDPRLQQFADAFTSPKFSREVVAASGPYALAEWVDGQRVVFTKKKNWWGDKLAGRQKLLAAYPDTIVFVPIADQTAAETELKNENIDVLLELDPKQFKDLQSNELVNGIFNLYTPPRFVFFYIALNTKNPKLADKRVRRALAHTLDMDMVINDLYDGFGERLTGPFLPDKKYYNKALAPIEMNIEKARQLLTDAGWTDTNGNGIVDKTIDGKLVELKIQCIYNPASSFQQNLTELLKNNAQKAGVEIERVQMETNVLREHMGNRDYEMSAGLGAGATPVPDDPKQFFHTDSDNPGGSNYSRFGNAESDALIEAIRNAPDEAARNGLYLKFQEVLYDEQPLIFLFAPKDRIAVHKRFEATITRNSPGVSLELLKLVK